MSLSDQLKKAAIREENVPLALLNDDSPYDWFKSAIDFVNTGFPVVIVGAKTIANKVDTTVIIKVTAVDGDIIDQLTVNFTTSGLAQEGLPRHMYVPPEATVSGIAGTIVSCFRCYSQKWAALIT